MTEAIFGLIGVIVGSTISWFQTYWTNKQAAKRDAKYLAIRVVCILDKFVEDCADVVSDDGLSFGQRTPDGLLEPQVKAPGPLQRSQMANIYGGGSQNDCPTSSNWSYWTCKCGSGGSSFTLYTNANDPTCDAQNMCSESSGVSCSGI